MNPSYRPTHRTQATVWSERGSWQVELIEAGGRVSQSGGPTLEVAIERAESKLYGG